MAKKTYCVNNYIPDYPTKQIYLHDILLRHEYERINNDKKKYFSEAKIINFDIIHNQCLGTPLKNSIEYYETINNENLQRAKEEDREDFVSEAIRSKRDYLFINKDILYEHFKLTPELIKFKQKNKALFSSMHRRKNKKSI